MYVYIIYTYTYILCIYKYILCTYIHVYNILFLKDLLDNFSLV